MKCNKCLKTIPEGEEIRFQVNSHYYGGCYCEECWKSSRYYQYYESDGKGFPRKEANDKILGMFWWFWLIVIFFLLLAIYWWKNS